MSVYFLRAGDAGPVKIGKAENPEARRRELQCAHYEKLVLIRVIPGGLPEEAWLHDHYSARRMRNEWFRWCPTMMIVVPPAGAFGGPLGAWLYANGITASAFGRSLGLKKQTMWKYVHGNCFPPADVLLRIREATAGEVTADDFVDQHTSPSPPPEKSAA